MTSTSPSLAELRQRYERGELPRDEFWLQSQREYRRLRERTPLPAHGAVRAIQDLEGELVMELADGLRMLWDPDDLRTAPNMILSHGVYEDRELAVLLIVAEHCQVAFDVGANVGWYSLKLARAMGPRGGRVYAFEPVPRTHEALRRNVGLNAMETIVTTLPLALADRQGEVEFFLPAITGSVAASQRPLFESQTNEKVSVRTDRLDDVAARLNLDRIDLVKADVEGGELLMLRGGLETIRRFRPVLFLELLRKWSRAFGYHPNDVIDTLGREGYRCHGIGKTGIEPLTVIDDACELTNFLFLHPASHTGIRDALAG